MTGAGNIKPPRHPGLAALRPSQWTKNGVVFAAFFFAFWDTERARPLALTDLVPVILAAFLFCLASSAIYVMNDILDAEFDRLHPVKRNRPIAAGLIPVPNAWILAAGLLVCALGGAWLLSRGFAIVVGAYVILQIAYTLALKRVALVDILVIAAGFVLRAIAGAVVLDIEISPWLLLCTFLLALFLGLCKRRHEKVEAPLESHGHRPALARYDERLLDQLIAIVAATTIISYALYTLWPGTVEKFGTNALGFSIPLVMFGVFRYLDLVYRHQRGGAPEKILLTDVPLLIDIALYGVCMVTIFLLHL